MTTSVRVSGGLRKYGPIWKEIKDKGHCKIKCSRQDTVTIVQGVRKEKVKDKNKPKGKTLKTDVTENGIEFSLVTDTSINNL